MFQKEETKEDESSEVNLSQRVKVYVRMRPYIEDEQNFGTNIQKYCLDSNTIVIQQDYEKRSFAFDQIFDNHSSQQQIFNTISKPVIEGILQGYNGTIFAYGQTGTGKTFTMMGNSNSPEERGVVPRTIEEIFEKISKDNKQIYSVHFAIVQIYMEIIQDLINPQNQQIRIRQCPENGVFVSGIDWKQISNPRQCLEIVQYAEKNRSFAITQLNANSSRSHVVYMVKVEKRNQIELEKPDIYQNNGSFILNKDLKTIFSSTLYLVDLAGSERVKKSRSTGDRLQQARSINSSLSVLGKCIHALSDPKRVSYVPFRESKLTRLLQDSLGGNAKTSLIVTIGPCKQSLEETISSLNFGSRAMQIQINPVLNQQRDYYALSIILQQEVDQKDDEINQLNKNNKQLWKQNHQLKSELEKVISEKNELEGASRFLKQSLAQNMNQQDFVKALEVQKNNEINILESQYKELLRKNEREYKNFLEEIDKTLLEQENEIDEIKNENNQLKDQLANSEQNFEEGNRRLLSQKANFEEHFSQITRENKDLRSKVQFIENVAMQREKEIKELKMHQRTLNEQFYLSQQKLKCIELSEKETQNHIQQQMNKLEIEKCNLEELNSKLQKILDDSEQQIKFQTETYELKIGNLLNNERKLMENQDQLQREFQDVLERENMARMNFEADSYRKEQEILNLRTQMKGLNEKEKNNELAIEKMRQSFEGRLEKNQYSFKMELEQTSEELSKLQKINEQLFQVLQEKEKILALGDDKFNEYRQQSQIEKSNLIKQHMALQIISAYKIYQNENKINTIIDYNNNLNNIIQQLQNLQNQAIASEKQKNCQIVTQLHKITEQSRVLKDHLQQQAREADQMESLAKVWAAQFIVAQLQANQSTNQPNMSESQVHETIGMLKADIEEYKMYLNKRESQWQDEQKLLGIQVDKLMSVFPPLIKQRLDLQKKLEIEAQDHEYMKAVLQIQYIIRQINTERQLKNRINDLSGNVENLRSINFQYQYQIDSLVTQNLNLQQVMSQFTNTSHINSSSTSTHQSVNVLQENINKNNELGETDSYISETVIQHHYDPNYKFENPSISKFSVSSSSSSKREAIINEEN